MHPDLEKLIRLHGAETELRSLRSRLSELPQKRAELDAGLAAKRAALDAAREGLARSQKMRRELEGEVQAREGKRAKYKGQLMEVKTNKEYTAVLHEIETVEREIRAAEDRILVEMEEGEGFAAAVKREELSFKDVEGSHRTEVKAVEEEIRGLEAQAARVGTERDAALATLSEELRDTYLRVAKLRGGIAVAEARDGACTACHLKLRLQMFVEIRRVDSVHQCPACQRLLFYEPPAPTVAVEP
jgi:predicted  nucleic acid-binding Zn-ribbon protein